MSVTSSWCAGQSRWAARSPGSRAQEPQPRRRGAYRRQRPERARHLDIGAVLDVAVDVDVKVTLARDKLGLASHQAARALARSRSPTSASQRGSLRRTACSPSSPNASMPRRGAARTVSATKRALTTTSSSRRLGGQDRCGAAHDGRRLRAGQVTLVTPPTAACTSSAAPERRCMPSSTPRRPCWLPCGSC